MLGAVEGSECVCLSNIIQDFQVKLVLCIFLLKMKAIEYISKMKIVQTTKEYIFFQKFLPFPGVLETHSRLLLFDNITHRNQEHFCALNISLIISN